MDLIKINIFDITIQKFTLYIENKYIYSAIAKFNKKFYLFFIKTFSQHYNHKI